MLILTVLTAIVLDGHIGPLALAGVATLVCGVVLVARGPGRIVDARVIAASGGFACALNAVLAKHARR